MAGPFVRDRKINNAFELLFQPELPHLEDPLLLQGHTRDAIVLAWVLVHFDSPPGTSSSNGYLSCIQLGYVGEFKFFPNETVCILSQMNDV
jgi:hypothetical protein